MGLLTQVYKPLPWYFVNSMVVELVGWDQTAESLPLWWTPLDLLSLLYRMRRKNYQILSFDGDVFSITKKKDPALLKQYLLIFISDTWILLFNLNNCNFISLILFQTALLSGRMATGNPTTEAQQAYDNFWPKVTDGKLISWDFFSPSAFPRNKKYVHCGPQAPRTTTGQDKEDNEAGWGCESE